MQQEGLLVNNHARIIGKIVSGFEFSHEVYGEGFYTFNVEAARLSEAADTLPITVSERLVDTSSLSEGTWVYILGQIRSYNNYVESAKRNRLVITIFAREIQTELPPEPYSPNEIYLNGFICKAPVYRTTPFGREITDLLIAVNRSYNKSDYIPCIAWGRNARYAGKLTVGENIRIWGRMQSRQYQKKFDTGETIEKTAFEVSVAKLECGEPPNGEEQ